jgi:hypothetical protein
VSKSKDRVIATQEIQMSKSVAANFRDNHAAKSAVGALLDHGAHEGNISLILPPGSAHDSNLEEPRHGISTTTGADAAAGATMGAEVGLGLGALAALAAVTLPGIGIVLGGGALATALAAAAATAGGGAIAGGVTGYLKDQGMSEEFARKTNDFVGSGGAAVSVVVPSGEVDAALASTILAKYGGELHVDATDHLNGASHHTDELLAEPIMKDHPGDEVPRHSAEQRSVLVTPTMPIL